MSGTDETGISTEIGEKIIENVIIVVRKISAGFLYGFGGGVGLICAIKLVDTIINM